MSDKPKEYINIDGRVYKLISNNPKPNDGSDKVYSGDIFTHQRTGKAFVFYSNALGTSIEEYDLINDSGV